MPILKEGWKLLEDLPYYHPFLPVKNSEAFSLDKGKLVFPIMVEAWYRQKGRKAVGNWEPWR